MWQMIDTNCVGSEFSIAHAANQHLLVPALQVLSTSCRKTLRGLAGQAAGCHRAQHLGSHEDQICVYRVILVEQLDLAFPLDDAQS